MTDGQRIPTGNAVLDTILGGGIPVGSFIVLQGEEGAGATEFAFTILRGVARSNTGRVVRFASALRTPAHVTREVEGLFENPKDASALDVRPVRPDDVRRSCITLFDGMGPGDVLVLESAAGILRLGPQLDPLLLLGDIAATAADKRVTVLTTTGESTLPDQVAAGLEEISDGLLKFRWRDGSTSRRRTLTIAKMRGLAPVLDGDEVPVFEIALHRGTGFALSRFKNVV